MHSSTFAEVAETLPRTLRAQLDGAVLRITLTRAHKRNALNEETVIALERVFDSIPDEVRAVVLDGEGDHFCAGLDLAEVPAEPQLADIASSRKWHRVFDRIQKGPVPVIAVLHGAVVGGGLELAATAHIRVAERSTFYGLPEAKHGIFVGGGASVRVPRILGLARMTDLMLTGRRYDAEEGHEAGLSQYLVGNGEGLAKAMTLAHRIAENARWSNFAIIQALPRIAEIGPEEGLFFESITAGFVAMSGEAGDRIAEFFGASGGE